MSFGPPSGIRMRPITGWEKACEAHWVGLVGVPIERRPLLTLGERVTSKAP